MIDRCCRYFGRAFLSAIVGFMAFFLVFWALQLAAWQFKPYKTADIVVPMEVLSETTTVVEGEKVNVIQSDEQLHIVVEFTKYIEATPTVSRNIVCLDGSVFIVPGTVQRGTARPVGTFRATPSYDLPEGMPRDTFCYFQFTNEYKVNPIRSITKTWQSEMFIVKD